MTPTASVPTPADWLAALVRSLHPARWLLALPALALTAAWAALTEAWLTWQAPRWGAWLRHPGEQAAALAAALDGRTPLGVALWLSLPLLGCAGAWCLVGGWIARHELLARRAARGGPHGHSRATGPTELVVARARALVLCCVVPVFLMLIALVPVAVAGWVNDLLGGVGALIVAVLLPLVLLSCFLLLAVGLGVPCWPLMPVAVAAEASDAFDALSRAYSYFFQRLLESVLLTAVALAAAAVPLVAASALRDEAVAWYLAAAVGASAFWSLEAVVYLHLRARVDQVEVGELAAAPTPPAPPPAKAAARGPVPLRGAVLGLALVAGAWCLMAWLFEHSGGAEAGWLAWGLAEGFVPPAQGLYKVASVIAAGWGALALGLPVLVCARALRRGGESDKGDRP